MRAIGYQTPLPIENPASLQDIELPKPVPSDRDLLVEIRAVSVNPVDTKVRRSATPDADQWRVLGWDAAGVVVGTGPDVTDFLSAMRSFMRGRSTVRGPTPSFIWSMNGLSVANPTP